MKYILILLLFASCQSEVTEVKQPPIVTIKQEIDTFSKTTDSLSALVREQLQRIDSNLYYGKLSMDYKDKEQQAQIDYLASGGEPKYERLFYKYQKLRVMYAKKANKFSGK